MLESTLRTTTLFTQRLSRRSLIETQDGTILFFQDWGAGKPVVFIHGWGVGADMWEYQMTALSSQGLRCIAYDRRGCGRSSQPGDGYDFDTFADDLATVIEQLDLHEVNLVSHSMGGGEVARYLSRHGANRIDRVVMIATTTPLLLKTVDNPNGIDKQVFDQMVVELNCDRPHYFASIAPNFFGVGLPDCSVSPEMMQWLVELALRASPKASLDMLRTQSETDLRADISAFTVPTLIIHGDTDSSAPLELTGQKTADAIPGSQLKVCENAAHGLFITHKERLNRDLLRDLQENKIPVILEE
ncbi:alpha/beta hydrolase [Nostocales cyanobacterium LEGE 12452]|nr:alpha/beta hydrolase [Nostocales cyanobacterium LEGE 12452]